MATTPDLPPLFRVKITLFSISSRSGPSGRVNLAARLKPHVVTIPVRLMGPHCQSHKTNRLSNMSGRTRGAGRNGNESSGQGAPQYLTLRIHASQSLRGTPKMGHAFGILDPPVPRRDEWGVNRWKTPAAEEAGRDSRAEQKNAPNYKLKTPRSTERQPTPGI